MLHITESSLGPCDACAVMSFTGNSIHRCTGPDLHQDSGVWEQRCTISRKFAAEKNIFFSEKNMETGGGMKYMQCFPIESKLLSQSTRGLRTGSRTIGQLPPWPLHGAIHSFTKGHNVSPSPWLSHVPFTHTGPLQISYSWTLTGPDLVLPSPSLPELHVWLTATSAPIPSSPLPVLLPPSLPHLSSVASVPYSPTTAGSPSTFVVVDNWYSPPPASQHFPIQAMFFSSLNMRPLQCHPVPWVLPGSLTSFTYWTNVSFITKSTYKIVLFDIFMEFKNINVPNTWESIANGCTLC